MEIEPLFKNARVEDMNMVCSTKRKADSEDKVLYVSDDVRDEDVIMVCTAKGKWNPENKCSSVSEEVTGAAFHN